mmetsp:Transcript_24378/g.75928  ORF Transcript_24378/g.75928 Transcript_24378/m.75928 type:complete len:220 (+) Transcript_24378:2510-3169(+)
MMPEVYEWRDTWPCEKPRWLRKEAHTSTLAAAHTARRATSARPKLDAAATEFTPSVVTWSLKVACSRRSACRSSAEARSTTATQCAKVRPQLSASPRRRLAKKAGSSWCCTCACARESPTTAARASLTVSTTVVTVSEATTMGEAGHHVTRAARRTSMGTSPVSKPTAERTRKESTSWRSRARTAHASGPAHAVARTSEAVPGLLKMVARRESVDERNM